MKKLIIYYLAVALIVLLSVSVSAKETVIIDDDFSADTLYQYDARAIIEQLVK